MTRPIFVVSDLHMGDGGPRDNFAHMAGGRRESEFISFLDYVYTVNGRLVINGDLFELWQANISKVLTYRVDLLDYLADDCFNTVYLLGNHDIDLLHFRWEKGVRLTHPIFRQMATSLILHVAHQNILICHGHEQDPYCCGENPGLGRASAIYTGLKEDRVGSPLRGKYGTVEGQALRRLTWPGRVRRWFMGEPSPTQVIRKNMLCLQQSKDYDAVIFGHTHEPGQLVRYSRVLNNWILAPIYNSGSWTEETCSFVRIDPEGTIGVYDWVGGKAVKNNTKLHIER